MGIGRPLDWPAYFAGLSGDSDLPYIQSSSRVVHRFADRCRSTPATTVGSRSTSILSSLSKSVGEIIVTGHHPR